MALSARQHSEIPILRSCRLLLEPRRRCAQSALTVGQGQVESASLRRVRTACFLARSQQKAASIRYSSASSTMRTVGGRPCSGEEVARIVAARSRRLPQQLATSVSVSALGSSARAYSGQAPRQNARRAHTRRPSGPPHSSGLTPAPRRAVMIASRAVRRFGRLSWPHFGRLIWPHPRPIAARPFGLFGARAGGRRGDGIEGGAVRADP